MRTERLFRTARARWQAGVWAACVAAWGGWGHSPVHAQVDAWAIGNQAVVMPPGTNGPASAPFALPQPNNPNYLAAWQYQGQVAQRSQHVRTAGDGRILFFEVDGKLYDGDGYMIADARAEDCTECLEPGVMEFVSVPVPGSCDLFYLFSGVADGSAGTQATWIQWALLDMNADNPRFPPVAPATCARKGRLVDQWTELGQGAYDQFDDMLGEFDPEPAPNGTSDRVGRLPSGAARSNAPRFRVVESASGNDHWLFSIIDNEVYVYRVGASGVLRVEPLPGQSFVPIKLNPSAGSILDYFFDADAIRTALPDTQQEVVALAITERSGLYMAPDLSTAGKNLLVLYFNTNTGALLPNESRGYYLFDPLACGGTGIPVPGGTIAKGLRGCAFTPNGQGLILTAESTTDCSSWQPELVHLDLVSDAVTDLSYAFGGPIDPNWVRTRIYRNTETSGNGPAIYFPFNGQVGVLQNLADLTTVSFTSNALGAVSPPVLFNGDRPVGCGYVPRFLDIGIAHDRYLSAENRGTCCTFLQTHGSGRVYGHRQTAGMTPIGWTATNNPYNNNEPLTCVCDLVVEDGAQLNTYGMDIRFAPTAKTIVERGGYLRIDQDGRYTSLQCPGERWPGIQLEGQTHAPNLPTNLQGNLRIFSSTIENALVGVRTGRFDDPLNGTGDPAYYGGRVLAYNSLFKDCNIGALIERHHANTANGGAEQPNQSLFSNCDFVTTNAWPGGQPLYGLFLNDVRHIRVNNCRFENQAPELFQPDFTGSGIFMGAATVRVLGSGDPTQSYMRNLRNGVVNSGAPFNPVQVDRMHFENNVFGILDFAGRGVNYSRNTFLVPDQGAAPSERRGMLLWQTRQMLVEQNSFTGEGQGNSVGIHFVSSVPSLNQNWGYTDERIYNNTFNNLAAGELVKGVHRGNSSGDLEAGLQLLCGDHTNNTFDIALLDQSLLKPNQGGDWIDEHQVFQYAGNRFYDDEDCTTRFDWAVDANWNVIPGWYSGMQLNYKRHEFPVDLVGVTCDQHPQFWDLPVPISGTFVKGEHCGNGDIPINPGSGPVRAAAYALAKSQLVSALDLYNGTVDLGETPDLMEAITHDSPWMPSAQLRDLLLTKHPLSDEALKAVLLREQPMDAWHLTQVLLQNSPLNRGLWNLAQDEEVLPPFFLNMLAQAQQGQGPSAKQLLEEEIAQRRLEMSGHMNVLIQIYGHDSTSTGSLDSLQRMMLFDKDPQFSVEYLESKMAKGDYTDAAQLLNSEWLQRNGKEVYADLLAMMQETQRQWEQLSAADKATLWAHAESTDQGAAMAAGILFATTGEAPLPPVAWPDFTKRAGAPAKPRRAAQWNMGNELAAYPNPARDRAYLVYPAALDGGVLNVFDAQGRLVHSMPLRGNGVLELQVAAWTPGLYQVSLAGTPLTTKLIVKP